ncbi:hypothetical protein ACIBJI_18020 [Nocardia sp. NPDC050408]|uniref:hypothetical protein n=1 Tax=unclassified Nocardia TaxID=2637762 RepID=UPI0034469B22
MSEGFRATPSGLHKPSADLAEVGGKIQAIVSRLNAENARNGAVGGPTVADPNSPVAKMVTRHRMTTCSAY